MRKKTNLKTEGEELATLGDLWTLFLEGLRSSDEVRRFSGSRSPYSREISILSQSTSWKDCCW